MTEAERVLAELAKRVHLATDAINFAELRTILEPYLPKPEPDRLTVAARECMAVDCTGASAKLIMGGKFDESDEFRDTRAIIAREVAAAEPSDEALDRVIGLLIVGRGINHKTVRAALKGE